MSTVQRSQSEGGKKGAEALSPFRATPEVISQFLELKIDEVLAQMKSVEGREELFAKLMEHEEHLRKIHEFNPDELRRQLDIAGEILDANEKYLKDVKSPEKKSAFRRAWDKMRGFAWRHPVVTALLLAALVAGGAALYYKFLGEGLLATLPNYSEEAVDVAKAGTQAVSEGLALPGAGQFGGVEGLSSPPISPFSGPIQPR